MRLIPFAAFLLAKSLRGDGFVSTSALFKFVTILCASETNIRAAERCSGRQNETWVVVCQTDCVSHDACKRAKVWAKAQDVPLVMMKRTGSRPFAAVLREIGRQVGPPSDGRPKLADQ